MTSTPDAPERLPHIGSHDPIGPGSGAGEPSRRFRLTRDGLVAQSDNLTDLIASLVGGDYGSLPATEAGDRQALLARWKSAVATANLVQAVVTVVTAERGVLDVASAGEDALTLLFANRIHAVDVEVWTAPVPLVLISTDYAPFTDRTPPTGNVRWINPHTELTFLESLNSVGAIEFEVETA